MVAHLTSYVFDPHKLPVKTINGNEVTVSGLLSFFEVIILLMYTAISLL
jgi:hypothetical protein